MASPMSPDLRDSEKCGSRGFRVVENPRRGAIVRPEGQKWPLVGGGGGQNDPDLPLSCSSPNGGEHGLILGGLLVEAPPPGGGGGPRPKPQSGAARAVALLPAMPTTSSPRAHVIMPLRELRPELHQCTRVSVSADLASVARTKDETVEVVGEATGKILSSEVWLKTTFDCVKSLVFLMLKSLLETIISDQLWQVFQEDFRQAAGLLRLHFHDCFVQGCDGSVLLDGSASGPSEKNAPPNLTLRPEGFAIIEDLRRRVHKACGPVVSCSDISGGPFYGIPLGRRDGLNFATTDQVLNDLPFPQAKVSDLLPFFLSRNLSITDMVALSGGHSIGLSNCSSFRDRLYPNQDPTLNQTFAAKLRAICSTNTSTNGTVLDVRTPLWFDNKYYVNLVNREGLFTSDQDLFTDARTRDIVARYADNEMLFFQQFPLSMIELGQIGVLTRTQGEIRTNCSARNKPSFVTALVTDVNDEEKATYI
ncbi:hypothetical protein Scep_018699 [Stephania cephalantha]|uniref:peroxidase n=1 Tax=Stephania cephalantha TaxID=152367 RepID=A0AAP0I9M3_9MAGN